MHFYFKLSISGRLEVREHFLAITRQRTTDYSSRTTLHLGNGFYLFIIIIIIIFFFSAFVFHLSNGTFASPIKSVVDYTYNRTL